MFLCLLTEYFFFFYNSTILVQPACEASITIYGDVEIKVHLFFVFIDKLLHSVKR